MSNAPYPTDPTVTSRPRVLLVDEDPADRSLASVVLSSACARPVCALGDGARLIATLKDGGYDAVVTEIGIDGASSTFQIEAIRAIQPGAPVIVFTHDDDPAARQRALAAGATAFVRKSTQGFLDLVDAVREAVEHGGEGIRAPEAKPAEPPRREAPFALDPLAPREPVAMDTAWSRRVTPWVERARSWLGHGVGRGVAIFLGVVAVSALLSALFGSFGRDDAGAKGGPEPSGVVLSATAESDESRADEANTSASPAFPDSAMGDPSANDSARPADVRPVTPAGSGPASDDLAPQDPAASEAPVALVLRASDDVWINARADGVEAFDLIMTAGQTRSVTARQHVELRIGNADGLSVIWNGKDIGRLGGPDQVRRLHFTPTKVGPGPPPTD